MSLNHDALYLIIDTIDASIFWKDLSGRYLGCNHYMVQMSGFKHRDEIIGKTDREMPWWQIADKLEAIDRSVLKNGLFEGEESPLRGLKSNGTKTYAKEVPYSSIADLERSINLDCLV